VTETTTKTLATEETLTKTTAAHREIQPIIEKYRCSVEAVVGYMSRAVALLEGLYSEQDTTIDQLKTILSRNKSLRRSDFDAIFANVLAERHRIRQSLSSLVEGYSANRQEIIQEVQELFGSNLAGAVERWPILKQRLLNEQDAGAGKVVTALRRIHMEQEELSTALSGLLMRGEKVKFDDLKTVARKLSCRNPADSAELAALLTMCESAARNADLKWHDLAYDEPIRAAG